MRDAAMTPPYHLSGPHAAPPPLLLASPHCGTHLPADFLAGCRLPPAELRRVEDAHVSRLLAGAVAAGAPLIAATHARVVCDLNRAEDELDPAMVAGGARPGRMTDRVRSGYGVLPRIVAPGREIHARRLTAAEADARIAALHRPWHAAIAGLLRQRVERHGFALLLDCHSMPTPPQTPALRVAPDVVLGTLHGRSAAPALTDLLAGHLRGQGWRVALNDPYAGGHTTQRHADPAGGVHVVQIEVARALYMNTDTLEPHAGFARVAAMFEGLARLALRYAPALLAPAWRDAAE